MVTRLQGIEMDMNIGTAGSLAVIVSAQVVTLRVCVLAEPRVRDGKLAEVVCGYFGD